ncbi:MAG: GNAT family N-acetyltransferase [Anaerolineae bacterium]
MSSVQPLYLPPVYQEAADSGRIILRDGTTATIRVAVPADFPALQVFFAHLSLDSRVHRFFSPNLPRPELVQEMCDPSDPHKQLTLLVERTFDGEPTIIAAASYYAQRGQKGLTAEAAFAVADAFQGKGIGSLLLERLAVIAVRHGIKHFWAVTHADNRGMIEVFKQSGFPVKTKWDGSDIAFDMAVIPSENSVARYERRDRVATIASVRPIFQPQSIAIIGASRSPSSPGHHLLRTLIIGGFTGTVYPVNPNAHTVCSIHAYPSVESLPETPDLAIIALPRDGVLKAVDECAAKGVRAVIVVASGFADAGPEGQKLQQELLEKVRGAGMRLVGPNSLGVMNTDPAVQMNSTFSPISAIGGHVAVASQSASLGLALLALAQQRQVGVSTFITLGNKADVSSNDLLQYWEEDEHTNVILLYLESFGNPRRFGRLTRRVSRVKPVVAVASGRAEGSGDEVIDALFHQTGVIRAATLDEMFDLATALTTQPLPRGRRVGIVTNTTGAGNVVRDAAQAAGLEVVALSDDVKAQLQPELPPLTDFRSSVDLPVAATGNEYRKAVAALLASDEIDALIVIYVHVGIADPDDINRAILDGIRAARTATAQKPVLVSLLAETAAQPKLIDGDLQVPVYGSPESTAYVLGKMATFALWQSLPPGLIPDFQDVKMDEARRICQQWLEEHGTSWLPTEQVWALLAAAGMPLLTTEMANTAQVAVRTAREIGYPVAVKLASSHPHKAAVGGVQLNVTSGAGVQRAYRAIMEGIAQHNGAESHEGVMVQPMVRGGVELKISVTEDPKFGPIVTFGLGGESAELLDECCSAVTPLTSRDAVELVQGMRGYPLLAGALGREATDVDTITDLLLRVSMLVEGIPEIAEIDLNPVFALPGDGGVWIGDARVKVATSP